MGALFRFLGGFVVGALVGGVAGLFLTPQSGSELQTTVRERINQVVEDGRHAAAERRAELEAQFAQATKPAR